MIPPTCPVHLPCDLASALNALGEATASSRVLAGGTDLMVEFEWGRTRPDLVVDVWQIDELRGITAEDGGVRIGALTTCAELVRDPLTTDILAEAAWTVGAAQIRARATIGGNLGTASPAADLTPVLLALDATVHLVAADSSRDVSARDFLVGYRETARRPQELIHSVFVPQRATRERRGFRKVGTRNAQAISKVVLALAATSDGVGTVTELRAAAGSIAEKTIELPSVAATLVGLQPTDRLLRAAARCGRDDCRAIDDVRSTASYRHNVAERLLYTLLHAITDTPA